jgi:hypothetical protein
MGHSTGSCYCFLLLPFLLQLLLTLLLWPSLLPPLLLVLMLSLLVLTSSVIVVDYHVLIFFHLDKKISAMDAIKYIN